MEGAGQVCCFSIYGLDFFLERVGQCIAKDVIRSHLFCHPGV